MELAFHDHILVYDRSVPQRKVFNFTQVVECGMMFHKVMLWGQGALFSRSIQSIHNFNLLRLIFTFLIKQLINGLDTLLT